MTRLFVTLFLLAIGLRAATVNVSLSISGNGSAGTAPGGLYSIGLSGSATLSPLGNPSFSGSGTFDINAIQTATTPINGTFTLDFGSGNTLKGTFSIPAGVLLPQSQGQSTGGVGNLTITGGTGTYSSASGSISPISGTGKATGLTTITFSISGTGTVTTVAPPPKFTISTVVGSGRLRFTAGGQPAPGATLVRPQYTVMDSNGNVYFSDSYYSQVFVAAPDGTIQVVAGNGSAGFSGDGGPATAAQLNRPMGLALDAAGNLYIADSSSARVRVVTPDGMINTFAGNGSTGILGNGGPATTASVENPVGIAADAWGNLYITEPSKNVVRLVDSTGVIYLFAGTGAAGFSADGTPAAAATLSSPLAVATDSSGKVYISDQSNLIRQIGADGTIVTLVGADAMLANPAGIAVGPDGTVYVSDSGNGVIRAVAADGTINAIAGGGTSVVDGAATGASLVGPAGLAVDPRNGGLAMAINGSRQIRYLPLDGTISTIAGIEPSGVQLDGSKATAVPTFPPTPFRPTPG